jgi:hypothetical protein
VRSDADCVRRLASVFSNSRRELPDLRRDPRPELRQLPDRGRACRLGEAEIGTGAVCGLVLSDDRVSRVAAAG